MQTSQVADEIKEMINGVLGREDKIWRDIYRSDWTETTFKSVAKYLRGRIRSWDIEQRFYNSDKKNVEKLINRIYRLLRRIKREKEI